MERAEWHVLHGKPGLRLSSYYHLPCDYGTSMMISWENGGVAPIYLCEIHVAQVSHSGGDVLATTPQAPRGNPATENPKTVVRSEAPPAAELELRQEMATSPVPVPSAPANSAMRLAEESIANVAREDFEAHGTVLQSVKKASAKEEMQAESLELERFCVSPFGERCASEAPVHCPKCGRWFCDAHAEDTRWHGCALPS